MYFSTLISLLTNKGDKFVKDVHFAVKSIDMKEIL